MRKNADVYRVVDCALLPAAPPGVNPPPRTDGAPVVINPSDQALTNGDVAGGIGGGIVFLLILGACMGGAILLKIEQKYSLASKLGSTMMGAFRARTAGRPVVNVVNVRPPAFGSTSAGTTQPRMGTPLTSDAAAVGSYAAPLPTVTPAGGAPQANQA